MEPTGHYGEPLAAGCKRGRSKELYDGTWRKTDEKDAVVIADLCRRGLGGPWRVPKGAFASLRVLTRRREQLVQRRRALVNRLHRHRDVLFPELRVLFPKVESRASCWVLRHCATPAKVKALGAEKLAEGFYEASRWQLGGGVRSRCRRRRPGRWGCRRRRRRTNWRWCSTLVATGTGSGKTECFLLPILDHCLRDNRPGVKAILIYPMNALATDQAGRIARLIHNAPALRGVRAGLYVGGEGDAHRAMGPGHLITDRGRMRREPPDILLTNYKMLDYLLLRPEDQGVWQHNAPGVLRSLVVDELHTFDGAQGTDLACLIRRRPTGAAATRPPRRTRPASRKRAASRRRDRADRPPRPSAS